MGSPPLAWGIPTALNEFGYLYRITPTCVGNTNSNGRPISIYEDHPHLRGEYFYFLWFLTFTAGSPPLAWGILLKHRNDD